MLLDFNGSIQNSIKKEKDTKSKKVFLLKHFVGFLEIYGQENYGESAEVNWNACYRYLVDTNLFDFNDELDNLVYGDYSGEEFRDKVYSYIENHAVNGFPLFVFFNMSSYLREILEKEILDKKEQEDRIKFNKYCCYRCKHFKDNVEVLDPNGYNLIPVKEFKERFPQLNIKNYNLNHNLECKLHKGIVDEYLNWFNEKYRVGKTVGEVISKNAYCSNKEVPVRLEKELTRYGTEMYKGGSPTYEKFNTWLKSKKGYSAFAFTKENGNILKFKLKPVKSCAKFEENVGMTFEKYVKENEEII